MSTLRRIAALAEDDHSTPAFLIEDGKPLVTCYGAHSADSISRVKRSTTLVNLAALDLDLLASELNAATEIQITGYAGVTSYNQVFRKPGTDTLYMFCRAATSTWAVARSDDYGATWGSPITLVDYSGSNQGYMTTAQVGSKVRCAIYGHPTSSTIHQIRYFEFDLTTGSITTRSGTVLGNLSGTNLPLASGSLEVVYDPDPDGVNTRLFEVSQRPDANGGPEILISTWTSDTDAIYYYIGWDGGAWTKRPIVAAGVVFGYTPAVHYNGGCCFARGNGGVVYVAREAAGTWYVEKKVTTDGGQTWATTQVATDTVPLIRPYVPIGASVWNVLWHRVTTYNDYTDYLADMYGQRATAA